MGPMITFKQYMFESSGKSKLSVDKDGVKRWFYNTKPHREDGPAIIYTNGDKAWYVNGKRHRLDGPAVELANGYKAWYVNGKRHRLDSPAIEWANGTKEWFINGKEMTENDFLVYTKQQDVKDAISKNDQSGWDL